MTTLFSFLHHVTRISNYPHLQTRLKRLKKPPAYVKSHPLTTHIIIQQSLRPFSAASFHTLLGFRRKTKSLLRQDNNNVTFSYRLIPYNIQSSSHPSRLLTLHPPFLIYHFPSTPTLSPLPFISNHTSADFQPILILPTSIDGCLHYALIPTGRGSLGCEARIPIITAIVSSKEVRAEQVTVIPTQQASHH